MAEINGNGTAALRQDILRMAGVAVAAAALAVTLGQWASSQSRVSGEQVGRLIASVELLTATVARHVDRDHGEIDQAMLQVQSQFTNLDRRLELLQMQNQDLHRRLARLEGGP